MYILPLNEDEIKRHVQQKAVYTVCMFNDKKEFYTNERDPIFCLQPFKSYNEIHQSSPFEIKKYEISDTKEKFSTVLGELYEEGITYEKLYCQTHVHENTKLKDIAIKELLLNKNW